MKSTRRTVIALVLSGILFWGGGFVLNFFENEQAFLKLPSPAFLAVQLSVGEGDSLLLVSPDRKVTLIDAGPAYNVGEKNERGWTSFKEWDAGTRVIIPMLKGLGVDRIDRMILTHHDLDHLGGFFSLLGRIPVTEVFDNGRGQLTRSYGRFREMLSVYGIPLKTLREGDYLRLGEGLFAQILSPQGGVGLDENGTSLVLRITFGNLEMLLGADVDALTERELCVLYGQGLKSDILKIPHHGSKNSNSAYFIKLADPKVAVISVGRGNTYGHPAAVVLKRYSEISKSRIVRTDKDGSILLFSNGVECYLATKAGDFFKIQI